MSSISRAREMDPALEDVHMNVETPADRARSATPAAGLHTARSRNDQVATDLRLYARRSALELVAAIDRSRLALCRRAREHAATLMPGLHAPAARAGGDAGPPPAGVRRDAGARSRAVASTPRGAPPNRRSARARWRARGCRSIARRPPRRSVSAAARRTTAWTPSRIATSRPRSRSRARCRASTCRASARSWCCGRRPSSASCASAKATARAAR